MSEPSGPRALRGSEPSPDLARLLEETRRWRAAGRRLVLVNGCFDLVHAGHVALLEAARLQGDVLIVAIHSDRSACGLKGPGRPVTPEAERHEILLALEPVDGVLVYDEPTPRDVIAALRPDVLVAGSAGPVHEIDGADLVEAWGGRLFRVQRVPGRSTTALLDRIQGL